MAVIGNSSTQQAFTPAVDYFSGNGSTTAFTLSRPVASVAQVEAVIDNVVQNPSSAYTVSGNTITFTSAPLSGTNNIYVRYTSPITQVIAPGQGTVTSDSFGTITNFTTTGNTVLGDATTDTLTVGVTGIVKDSSGNVGIGTTSPSTKLSVVQNQNGASQVSISNNTGGASSQALFSATDGTNYGQFGMWGSGVSASGAQQPSNAYVYGSGGVSYFTGGTHRWYYNTNTEAMRIDSSGNVGIGTTSPTNRLHVAQTGSDSTTTFQAATNAYAVNINLLGNDASGSRYNNITSKYGSTEQWYIGGNGSDATIAFRTGSASTERMRIDSSGNLLVGTTSVNSGKLNVVYTGTYGVYVGGASGASTQMIFFSGATNTGSISSNGSNTAFNTSSDYRLKENISPMTGCLSKVQALKPVTYRWKESGLESQGFIAHELAEVCPEAVTGAKDAVDVDGNPVYQGIDTSFLVATLTAAIQELKAINDTQAETINALTARIEALENK